MDSSCSIRGTLHPSTRLKPPACQAVPKSVHGPSAAVDGQEERIARLAAFYAAELARRAPPAPLWLRALRHVAAHGETPCRRLGRLLGVDANTLGSAVHAPAVRHYFARRGAARARAVGATAAGLAEVARRGAA